MQLTTLSTGFAYASYFLEFQNNSVKRKQCTTYWAGEGAGRYENEGLSVSGVSLLRSFPITSLCQPFWI